ncbi:MAG: DMT family transporter [Rhodospirillaceae bacterium]|nr:DMT family transporter [Rhodospirillaceae bacterium]
MEHQPQKEICSTAAKSEGQIGPNQAYMLISMAVFLWAFGVVVARGVHEEIPLIGLSFWRWFVASMAILPFVFKELLSKFDVVRQNIRLLLTQGILIVGSGAVLFVALMFTTAINASLVNAAQPVFTVFLARIIIGDRLSRIQMLGITVGVIGVISMIAKANVQVLLNFEFNIGDLLVVLAIVGYAAYAINLRKLPNELGTFASLFVILFLGSLCLFPFYIAEAIYIKPLPFNGFVVFLVLILALGVSIASMAMWNKGNRVVGPSRAAIFINLLPVFGSIMAIIFLDEELYVYHFFGAILVCAGIFMVVRESKKESS